MAEKPPLPPPSHDTTLLSSLGYTQELTRSFSAPGMLGFAFSIVTSWTALGGVFIIGVQSGGPPVMIFSWLAISLLSLAVAGGLAEICSAYPVAGGQYSWVMVLAPRRWARGMSWITGWFMITALLAMGAANNFIAANFLLGMAVLAEPGGYAVEQWQTVLVAYAVVGFSVGVNVWARGWLERLSWGMMVWNVCSFVIVVVTILACRGEKQPASFVFTEFQNLTGWGPGMAAILGVLQSAFGMCCYDAPAHMTEELHNASRSAPKAIVLSVLLGGVTGLIFLIAVSFCISDFETVASTPTGVPLLQVFYDATGSVPAACILASLLVVIFLMCAVFIMAEGSRSLYAFARDRGLPFSGTFARVNERRGQVPVNAVLLAAGVQMALNSIYFGTAEGFSTVVAIATEAFYLSYATPLLSLLLSRLFHYLRPASNPAPPLNGPYSLGRYSTPLSLIGLLFLLFASITFNLPGFYPVTAQNMNYTSAAIGVIGLISAVTWIVDGRRNFTGPRVGVGKDGEEVGVREVRVLQGEEVADVKEIEVEGDLIVKVGGGRASMG